MQINKKIFCFFTILIVNFYSFSQNYSSALDISGGYVYNGFGGLANYNYYNNNKSFFQIGLFVSENKETQNDFKINYNDITLNVGYFSSLFSNNFKTIKLNIGGGLLGGYEIINNGKSELSNGALIKSESQFIYGAFGSLETEFYINNDFSLIFKFNQFYHANSDLGELVFIAGVGVRFFIY